MLIKILKKKKKKKMNEIIKSDNLFEIANQIEESGYWKIALTESEYEKLSKMLKSQTEWNKIMNLQKDKKNDGEMEEEEEEEEEEFEEMDFNLSMDENELQENLVNQKTLFHFRLRSVIFDYLLKTVLYPDDSLRTKEQKEKEKKIINNRAEMHLNSMIPIDDVYYSLEIDENDWKKKEEIRENFIRINVTLQ